MNAPVTTFEYGGSQYVVALSAGNLFSGSAKGDSVWLFALDGTLDQVAPGVVGPPPAPPPPPPEPVADLRNGARVYQSVCAFCHGDNGRGGTGGGASLSNSVSVDDVITMVTEGRNMMPSLAGSLDEAQIRDVAAYVMDRFASGE
jgi:mono/diheme cytochrome c family protein